MERPSERWRGRGGLLASETRRPLIVAALVGGAAVGAVLLGGDWPGLEALWKAPSELEGPASGSLLATLAALGILPLAAIRLIGLLRARRTPAAPSPARVRQATGLGALTLFLLAVGLVGFGPRVPPLPDEPGMAFVAVDDEALRRVLDGNVSRDGRVDYAALLAHPEDLDRWYRSVAWLDPIAVAGWDEPTRIAFWCNVYNGLTLLAIRENLPIRRTLTGTLAGAPGGSIRQIPGVWEDLTFQAVGEPVTLNHVEHGILRVRFDEPRIHVAINCASVGCPPLRNEPFTGARLDALLDDQVLRFLASPDRFSLDREAGSVGLSRILEWFGSDFAPPATGFASQPPELRGPLAFVAR